jgi:hypothetical protein
MCGRHVLGLVLGFVGSAAPAWLRGLGLRGVIFVLVIVVVTVPDPIGTSAIT